MHSSAPEYSEYLNAKFASGQPNAKRHCKTARLQSSQTLKTYSKDVQNTMNRTCNYWMQILCMFHAHFVSVKGFFDAH